MKGYILYLFLFVIGYVILTITTAMFFLTWGAKRNIFESIYVFFIGTPFDWSKSLWFLPLNGFCWATFFYLKVKFYKKWR